MRHYTMCLRLTASMLDFLMFLEAVNMVNNFFNLNSTYMHIMPITMMKLINYATSKVDITML